MEPGSSTNNSRKRKSTNISTSTRHNIPQSQEPGSSSIASGNRKSTNISTPTEQSIPQSEGPSRRKRTRRSRAEIEATMRRGINTANMNIDYWDTGDADCICQYCHAYFWNEERKRQNHTTSTPEYRHCCLNGKVELPQLKRPPQLLLDLTDGITPRSKHFIQNIRSYNSMFSFTSMGGKIDNSMNKGNGPPVFKLQGQNYHRIGSLLPIEGEQPKFAQLYIHDTTNEISNRINFVR
ncbi:hypothetical protein CASFOL_027016 [Castilleja foliolosa]|uniref:Uncharacterized protein n=1 Tax=Castilleja foliolosa TaxID=1961234 RepID=A0ABD3CKP0_9LAMI